LLKLRRLAGRTVVALMWQRLCRGGAHRNLLSDALLARPVRVMHIISKTDTITHQLNEAAHVDGYKVSYPLFINRRLREH